MQEFTKLTFHIHLGAHKTASTFIQRWLASNLQVLREHGVAYVPLEILRNNFTPVFSNLANNKTDYNTEEVMQLRNILLKAASEAGSDLTSAKIFILSEENLMGTLDSLHLSGLLYPNLQKRMQTLSHLFDGCRINIFLSIRDFRTFYPSAFAEGLRHGHKIETLEDFLFNLQFEKNSWTKVVEIIENFFGQCLCWKYEDFRNNSHSVISQLIGYDVQPEQVNVTNVVRPSLSMKGLQLALNARTILSPSELKKFVNVIINHMQFNQPNEKITINETDPLLRFLSYNLQLLYENDINKLKSNFIL